jgi:hypothetical protein
MKNIKKIFLVMWMEQDVLCRLAGESKNEVFSSNGVALAAITRNW